jgi:hypothetical protein
MTQLQIILSAVAVVLWVTGYFWFFHADLARWFRFRSAIRAEDRRVTREQLEQQARMIDELAQRYQLPAKRLPLRA